MAICSQKSMMSGLTFSLLGRILSTLLHNWMHFKMVKLCCICEDCRFSRYVALIDFSRVKLLCVYRPVAENLL